MSSNDAPLSIEVVEANDDEAWAQWEDSVSFQDSQFFSGGELAAPVSPAQAWVEAGTMDPFASVTKNSG